MNHRTILLVSVACLAAAGLSLWLIRRNQQAQSLAGSDRSTSVAEGAGPALTFEPFPEFGRMEFGSKEFNKVCRERLLKWLAVHRRDAASLIAACDIASDREFLQKAEEAFPEEPRLCMAMISRDIDREIWINRLIIFEPANPAGNLLKAEFLSRSPRPDDAIAATDEIQKASARSKPPDYFVRQRLVALREAAAGIGMPAWETAMLCRRLRAIAGGPILSKPFGLLKKEIQAAKASGDPNEAARLARICAFVGSQISRADMAGIIEEMIGNEFQITGLSELDAGDKWSGTNQTVGERLAEVKQQKAESSERFAKIKDRSVDILKASGPQLLEYEDRLLRDGELSAEIWYHETVASQRKAAE